MKKSLFSIVAASVLLVGVGLVSVHGHVCEVKYWRDAILDDTMR